MTLVSSYWPVQLRKTQDYLRCRIAGSGCDRDQIEAWRQFYRTQDPRIRSLVSKAGLPESMVDQCVEDVWLNVLAVLPTLRELQTEDSFAFWLNKVVRETSRNRQSKLSETDGQVNGSHLDSCLSGEDGSATNTETTNDRLLYLRIIENQPIERVARTLQLTCQEVSARQHRLLKSILGILIRLDVMAAP